MHGGDPHELISWLCAELRGNISAKKWPLLHKPETHKGHRQKMEETVSSTRGRSKLFLKRGQRCLVFIKNFITKMTNTDHLEEGREKVAPRLLQKIKN